MLRRTRGARCHGHRAGRTGGESGVARRMSVRGPARERSTLGVLPLGLLGALLGLDVVSFPQAMISRPIVAATIAGALVGAPGRGLVVWASCSNSSRWKRFPSVQVVTRKWGSASVVGACAIRLNRIEHGRELAIAVCVRH